MLSAESVDLEERAVPANMVSVVIFNVFTITADGEYDNDNITNKLKPVVHKKAIAYTALSHSSSPTILQRQNESRPAHSNRTRTPARALAAAPTGPH